MKIVRFTTDMAPWQKGQDAALPDSVADRLVKSGEAEDPRPFPPQDIKPPADPLVLSAEEQKTRPSRRYLTRKG